MWEFEDLKIKKDIFKSSNNQIDSSSYRFPPVADVIFKNIFAQTVQRAVECLAAVGLGKLAYKLLQVWVFGNHKRGNRDFKPLTLSRHVQCFIHHFAVEPDAVFVIFSTLF